MDDPKDVVQILLKVEMPDGRTVPFNFSIPRDTFNELQEIAEKRGESLVDVILEGLSLRRLFAELQDAGPDNALIVKRGKQFQELVAL